MRELPPIAESIKAQDNTTLYREVSIAVIEPMLQGLDNNKSPLPDSHHPFSSFIDHW